MSSTRLLRADGVEPRGGLRRRLTRALAFYEDFIEDNLYGTRSLGCIVRMRYALRPSDAQWQCDSEFRGNSFPNSLFVMFTNGNNCSGRVKLPAQNSVYKPGAKPLVIAANNEFAFSVFATRNRVYGSITTSFMPKSGAEYVALAESRDDKCFISISRRDSSAGQSRLVHEPSQRERVQSTPWSGSGAFCEP